MSIEALCKVHFPLPLVQTSSYLWDQAITFQRAITFRKTTSSGDHPLVCHLPKTGKGRAPPTVPKDWPSSASTLLFATPQLRERRGGERWRGGRRATSCLPSKHSRHTALRPRRRCLPRRMRFPPNALFPGSGRLSSSSRPASSPGLSA